MQDSESKHSIKGGECEVDKTATQDGGDGTCHRALLGRAHGKEWWLEAPMTERREKRK